MKSGNGLVRWRRYDSNLTATRAGVDPRLRVVDSISFVEHQSFLSFARGRDLCVIVAHTVRKMLLRAAAVDNPAVGDFQGSQQWHGRSYPTRTRQCRMGEQGLEFDGSRRTFDILKAVFTSECFSNGPLCKLLTLLSSSASAVQKHLADLEFSAYSCTEYRQSAPLPAALDVALTLDCAGRHALMPAPARHSLPLWRRSVNRSVVLRRLAVCPTVCILSTVISSRVPFVP